MDRRLQTYLLLFNVVFLSSFVYAQGNHVFSGGEAANFGTISLSSSTSWSTDRTATPGYFSAVGTATYTDAGDANNVNGYVKHYTNAADQGFSFPVGTGTDLRTLTTSGTISNNSEFGVAWISGDPTVTTDPTDGATHDVSSFAAPILSVSTAGQWDWVDISNTGAGTTITVSMPNLPDFDDDVAIADAPDLRLVGWDGSQWINLGTAGSADVTEDNTLTGTMQAGITAIGIGAITTILPVELVNFDTEVVDCEVLVTWNTATETNNSHFEILRSDNGVDGYEVIGTVQGNGTTLEPNSYTLLDSPGSGEYYYKLRQVDFNGVSELFDEIEQVSIECSRGETILFPNPLVNSQTLTVQAENIEQIAIYDAIGRLMYTNEYPNVSEAYISITNYAAGTYFLIINNKHDLRFIVSGE